MRNLTIRLTLVALVFGLGIIIPASSKAASSDFQAWLQVQPRSHLSESLSILGLVQWRVGRGKSDQILTDVMLASTSGDIRMEGGISTLSKTHPLFGALEWRPWLGLAGQLALGSTDWYHRVRMEFRFLSLVPQASYRFRYLTGFLFTRAFSDESFAPFIENEIFLTVNTIASIASGFDQNRFRVGLRWNLASGDALDFSYMNLLLGSGASQVMVHVPLIWYVLDL